MSLRAKLAALRELLDQDVLALEPTFFAHGFSAVAGDLDRVRPKVRALGLWTPHLKDGPAALSLVEHAHVSEILGRSPLGHYVANCQAPDAGNMELLLAAGSAEQRQRWFVPLAAGEIRSCFAMTEPDRPGSNPTWIDTRAEPTADGWTLTGRKWFASSADGAAFAIVMATTDPEAPPHRRASLFIVPTDSSGYRLVGNLATMGDAGDGWASHGEIELDSCRLPADALLGARGAGFRLAQRRLGPGRIHHAMRWIGIAERSFDLLCERAIAREIAPGAPLGAEPVVLGWIAEARARIDAARGLVLSAAVLVERDGDGGASKEARIAVALVKFHTVEAMELVVDRALQAHGALGMTDRTPLAWFYRHERAARIYDGADEVHRAAAGRMLLEARGLARR